RGVPHFNSPEKLEFLRAFLRFGDILTSIYTLRHNRHFNHSPIQWQHQSKGGLSMNINYIRVGDYFIPDLTLPEEIRPIGKWERMHRDYLREHKPIQYNCLLLSGKLWTYLADLN